MKAVLAVLVLGLVGLGCSGDNTVMVQGPIIGAPTCDGALGQFQMLTPDGFGLLVFVGQHARVVLPDGQRGGCPDLAANMVVNVSGTLNGQTITAQTVQVQ
jgi:hypothetical protein